MISLRKNEYLLTILLKKNKKKQHDAENNYKKMPKKYQNTILAVF